MVPERCVRALSEIVKTGCSFVKRRKGRCGKNICLGARTHARQLASRLGGAHYPSPGVTLLSGARPVWQAQVYRPDCCVPLNQNVFAGACSRLFDLLTGRKQTGRARRAGRMTACGANQQMNVYADRLVSL